MQQLDGDGKRDAPALTAREMAVLRDLGLLTEAPPPPPEDKTEWTVGELYRTDLASPIWVVPELLPAGLAALAGRPKIGKSLLALQLAAAVALGGEFLGYQVTAGPVLYLALEDSPQRLQERLRRLGVAESAPIRFYTRWRMDEVEALREMVRCVLRIKPRLVVIDTLSRALRSKIAHRADLLSTVLQAWQELARGNNCCVLMVDHHRKIGQKHDAVADLQGFTSKAAVLDTVWGLYRGRDDRGVCLRVTGREVTPCDMELDLDPRTGQWQLRPQPEATPKETAATRVERTLAALGGIATTAEMASALGLPESIVSRALTRLVASGRVRRLPRAGRRVRYELLSPLSARIS